MGKFTAPFYNYGDLLELFRGTLHEAGFQLSFQTLFTDLWVQDKSKLDQFSRVRSLDAERFLGSICNEFEMRLRAKDDLVWLIEKIRSMSFW